MKPQMRPWTPHTGDKLYGRLLCLEQGPSLFVAVIKSGNTFFQMPDAAAYAFEIAEVSENQEIEIIRTPSGYCITQAFPIKRDHRPDLPGDQPQA